jgi:hypothetical protein
MGHPRQARFEAGEGLLGAHAAPELTQYRRHRRKDMQGDTRVESRPLDALPLTLFLFRSIVVGTAATRRRYPPPWQVEEHAESFIVKDSKGQPLAYVYFEDEPQRRMIMNRIGKDDAWQLARAITRIPGLLQRD